METGLTRVTGDAGIPGESVPAYRLYRLDGADKIDSADWIEAATEESAISAARERVSGGFELWHGRRLVVREPAARP